MWLLTGRRVSKTWCSPRTGNDRADQTNGGIPRAGPPSTRTNGAGKPRTAACRRAAPLRTTDTQTVLPAVLGDVRGSECKCTDWAVRGQCAGTG